MTHSSKPQSSLLRGTAVVASLTLLSRFFGFFREVLVARLFGASTIADTYFIALRIPNMLRSIFAEGALTSAFIPVFAERLHESRQAAHKAFKAIATSLLIVTGIITLLGIYYAHGIVSFIAPGFTSDPEQFELAVSLTQIMFPYIMCVSLITLFNGALNSVYIFGISAWAQVVMNIVLILSAYFAAYWNKTEAAHILAYSVVIGGIIQVITQMPALKRAGFPLFFLGNPISKSTASVAWLMIPAVFGAKLYQLTVFVSTQLASSLEAGSVAWLSYADRLVQLPVGVVTIALSSVLLPTLAKTASENNHEVFNKSLIDSLRFTVFIMIPVTAGLFLFAPFFVSVFLQRGAFDVHASINTAQVARGYAVGLIPVSLHALLIRALQAKKDTLTPTVIGLFTLFFTVVFCLLLTGELPRLEQSQLSVGVLQHHLFDLLNSIGAGRVVEYFTTHPLGAVGLSLGSSLSLLLTSCLSAWIVTVRNPLLSWKPFLLCFFKTLVAAVIASCITFYYQTLYPIELGILSIKPIIAIVIFTVFFTLGLKLLHVEEFKETLKKFSRFTKHDKRHS